MRKLRGYLLKNPILYRMIAGYTLLSALVILVVVTLLYNVFRQELEQEIFHNQEKNLELIANTVNFRAEYANYLMQQVVSDREISSLFYQNAEDTKVTALKKLGEMRQRVKQLESIYIYNEYEKVIYGSWERPFSFTGTPDGFEDQGFVEILNNIGDFHKYTPYLRRMSIEMPNGQIHSTYVYTYLLYDVYSTNSVKNIIAFNFHLGWMEDALEFITNEKAETERIWIVNEEKKIVYSDSGELIGADASGYLPEDAFGRVSGYQTNGVGDNQEMLIYATPNRSGYDNWTFFLWEDYSAILMPMERVRTFVYLVCIFALFASLGTIILLSHSIYRPVRQTMDKMKMLEDDQLQKLKTDRRAFIRRLFQGNETGELQKIRECFQKYGINFELNREIRLRLLSVDYADSFRHKYGRKMEQVDKVMNDLLEELCGETYDRSLNTKLQDGVWGICSLTDESDLEEDQKKLFRKINDILDEQFGITVSMAVTDVGHSVRDIPFLYAEAMNVVSYRYLLGQNRIITSDEVKNLGLKKFEYPYELEKNLLSKIFSGKGDEALEAFDRFVNHICDFAVGEIRLSFMLLAYAIKNASLDTTSETSSILIEFDQFYKKIQDLETVEEVKRMFVHLINEITELLQSYSRERRELLIGRMKEYVELNYGEISLSMGEVADYMDMSAAYLGRLFKQVTEITFTEYLTNLRLQKACKLLEETDMTVNDISDKVGFTNSSYFYIVFKKNMGCTPNQYRKR